MIAPKMFEHEGELLTWRQIYIRHAAELQAINVSQKLFRERVVKRGWTVDRALFEPHKDSNGKYPEFSSPSFLSKHDMCIFDGHVIPIAEAAAKVGTTEEMLTELARRLHKGKGVCALLVKKLGTTELYKQESEVRTLEQIAALQKLDPGKVRGYIAQGYCMTRALQRARADKYTKEMCDEWNHSPAWKFVTEGDDPREVAAQLVCRVYANTRPEDLEPVGRYEFIARGGSGVTFVIVTVERDRDEVRLHGKWLHRPAVYERQGEVWRRIAD